MAEVIPLFLLAKLVKSNFHDFFPFLSQVSCFFKFEEIVNRWRHRLYDSYFRSFGQYKIEQDFQLPFLFDTNNCKKQKVNIAICSNIFFLLKSKIFLLVSILMYVRIFNKCAIVFRFKPTMATTATKQQQQHMLASKSMDYNEAIFTIYSQLICNLAGE